MGNPRHTPGLTWACPAFLVAFFCSLSSSQHSWSALKNASSDLSLFISYLLSAKTVFYLQKKSDTSSYDRSYDSEDRLGSLLAVAVIFFDLFATCENCAGRRFDRRIRPL